MIGLLITNFIVWKANFAFFRLIYEVDFILMSFDGKNTLFTFSNTFIQFDEFFWQWFQKDLEMAVMYEKSTTDQTKVPVGYFLGFFLHNILRFFFAFSSPFLKIVYFIVILSTKARGPRWRALRLQLLLQLLKSQNWEITRALLWFVEKPKTPKT